MSWVVVMEIARPDGGRHLAHRGGGGLDGTDAPMCWTALGMLESGATIAREQVSESTEDAE